MALLDVKSVSKRFGALRAVDGVTFSVEAGEIFGIAGPNGSGKSTLFNILTKIPFGPDTGEVIFDGKPMSAYRADAIVRLGLVRTFQRETCFESLSVFENAMLSAISSRPERVTTEAVSEALGLLGFSEQEFARPAQLLSVFDRKRLMMASAVACRPKMILLDEPASGLTKPEIDKSAEYVRSIVERGTAILLIEHVLPFLMSLSTKMMVLNNGRIIGLGDPHTVMRDEAIVEAYLGSRKLPQ
ncbi:MAG TPA: ATP-binding cassette domain-containing protein [Rhizobiaceae bacterium]|nr:ATP-binding cassette domain-containing protein [Rhizobiaceae bacterium]